MRWRRGLAGAVATALIASGCTTGAGQPPAEQSHAADTAASTASAPVASTSTPVAPVPPAPERSACYRLRFADLTEPSNDSRPVPCSGRHDAQTIHVGRLDTHVDGHAVAVDSDRVLRQLSTECPRRLAAHLGGTREDLRLSRFEVVWFSPTLVESDLGARWFRCDVVALAGQDTLFPLPPPRRLEGVLDGSGAATYGLCGTAAPGDPDFDRVICGRRHSWQAVATIPISGGTEYPGRPAARAAGEDTCLDRVRESAEDPLTFQYGWEWPTREQWRDGQRFGYCWAPTQG